MVYSVFDILVDTGIVDVTQPSVLYQSCVGVEAGNGTSFAKAAHQIIGLAGNVLIEQKITEA